MNTPLKEMTMNELVQEEHSLDEQLKKLKLQAARGLDITTELVDTAGKRKAVTEQIVELNYIREKKQDMVRAKAEEEYFKDVATKAAEIKVFNANIITDPIACIWIWAAICQNLQFQIVGTEKYVDNLHIRRSNEVEAKGSPSRQDSGTEGVVSTENMIQEAEQKLDELQILRIVAEREYDKASLTAPAKSTWIPAKRSKTDEQLRLAGDIRSEEKAAKLREDREKQAGMLSTYRYARRAG